jgi:uncharacterized NAD-dependent epimerase/dehydratase family protein
MKTFVIRKQRATKEMRIGLPPLPDHAQFPGITVLESTIGYRIIFLEKNTKNIKGKMVKCRSTEMPA